MEKPEDILTQIWEKTDWTDAGFVTTKCGGMDRFIFIVKR